MQFAFPQTDKDENHSRVFIDDLSGEVYKKQSEYQKAVTHKPKLTLLDYRFM